MRALQLLLFFFIATPSVLNAQFLRYRNYDVEDGLPSSEVYGLLQDSRGFIWLTTDMGVSRYDGYGFTNYSTEHGLPDNTIFSAYEDHKGRIWFTSFSGRLSFFENERIHTLPCNQRLQELVKGQFITSIYVDVHDTVWLGTTDSIYIQIAPSWNTEQVHTHTFKGGAGYLCVIDSGLINGGCYWAAGQVNVYRKNEFQYSIEAIPDFTGQKGARYAALQLKNGDYALTANTQLVTFNASGVTGRVQLNGIGICLLEEEDGSLAVGAYGGLYRFAADDLQLLSADQKLERKIVTTVLRDRENGMWYGTEGNGVFTVAYNSFLYYTIEDGLTDSKITCAAATNGMMCLGHINGTVSVLKGTEIRMTTPENNQLHPGVPNRIASMLPGKDNEVVVSTGNGIYIVDLTTLASREVSETGAKKIIRAHNGSLWAFRFRRLTNFDGTTFRNIHADVFPNYADNIFEDSEGKVWICAIDGAWMYDSIRGFSPANQTDSLLASRIVDVGETANHVMWFATRGNGVIVKTRDTVFQIQRVDGLAGNMCRALLIDTGHTVWVGTNSGLSKIHYSAEPEFTYTVETYTTDAGLLTNEVNQVLHVENKLVLVHTSCVSVCDPAELARHAFSPPVYIMTAYQSADSSFVNGAQFNHTQNYFTFTYVGLSFRDPGKIHYRYKLEGADTDWRLTTVTSAAYQSLPPGDYRFVVEANTGGNVWSSSADISFTILPAWWQTWFFKICMVVLLAMLIYLVFRWRISIINRRHLRKTELQNRLAAFELNALRAQMNPHFVFNSINSVQYFITNNDADSSQKYLAKFARLIRYVVDNSKLSTISLTKEIEALRLYMDLEALRFGNRLHYEIHVDENVDSTYVQIPSMLIQPYVENAIWHGIMHKEGSGKITVTLRMEGSILCCIIEDDGIGRQRSQELKREKERAGYKSVGMTNTKERLEIINHVTGSNLSVLITDLTDSEGNASGTRVKIHIPV